MSEHEKFWIVARDLNNLTATHRHESFEAAQTEAQRLCEKERKPFFVFEAVAVVEIEHPIPPTKWTTL